MWAVSMVAQSSSPWPAPPQTPQRASVERGSKPAGVLQKTSKWSSPPQREHGEAAQWFLRWVREPHAEQR
jgi:hypothetical protein